MNTGGRNESGMTLVEVVLAAGLLVLVFSAVYCGVVQGLQMNYASAQHNAAFGLCRERVEQMRAADFDAVTEANFPSNGVVITHLGGTARVPLVGTIDNTIATLVNPHRKAVTVTVAWTYRGKDLSQSVSGMIFSKDAAEAPSFWGDLFGSININPNNRPDNEFTLQLKDGSMVTRDDLTQDYAGLPAGTEAVFIHVRPKGNGNQNSLTLNGDPYVILNSASYDISSETMTVRLWNDNINPHGKALGKWWIDIVGTGASIVAN